VRARLELHQSGWDSRRIRVIEVKLRADIRRADGGILEKLVRDRGPRRRQAGRNVAGLTSNPARHSEDVIRGEESGAVAAPETEEKKEARGERAHRRSSTGTLQRKMVRPARLPLRKAVPDEER